MNETFGITDFKMLKKIKVGLLIDSMLMPVWVQEMLESISAMDGIKIVLVIQNAAPRKQTSLLKKIISNKGTLLYSFWRIVDRRIFGVIRDALAPVDLTEQLAGIPSLSVVPEQTRFSDYFSKQDIEKISRYEIDVFIRLGFRVLRGEILNIPSCGIWSYHHGDNQVNRGGPAAVWEVLHNQPTTGSVLQILTEDLDGGKVLYRSWSATDPYSISRNLNNVYWKTVSFVPRMLKQLKRMGTDEFMKCYDQPEKIPFIYHDPLYGKPDNKTAARLLTKLVIKIVSRMLWRLHSMEQWMLLYSVSEEDTFPTAVFRFKQLLPPKDRFWADPCVFQYQGKRVIFIEECECSDNKGYLSVIEFDHNNTPQLPPVKILKKSYHLSFPFVFEDHDDLYLIPESQENKTIEIYRCRRFPDQWDFVMNLMENVRAVDSVIWKYENKYWLFTNIVENRGASACDELFLYSSDNLLSQEWQAHPANPIVSDVRCARSAGKIFQFQGQWYRPAQDCSGVYGKAISIQRIEMIDEINYSETAVSRIEPGWDDEILRTHSFSQMGQLACLDGLKKRTKFK